MNAKNYIVAHSYKPAYSLSAHALHFGVPVRKGACSLHGLEQWDAVDVIAASFVLNGLLEVHTVFCHNYQRLFVITKGADLFALRGDAKLFDRAVA